MQWVCGDAWPPRDGETGFDPVGGGWPARAWILNAVYERSDIPSGLTHHDARRMSIDAGAEEPVMVNDVNLDDLTVTTGATLGFAETPAPPWHRLSWSDLGSRDDFDFWAVDGKWPHLRFTAQGDWPDPSTMPAGAWPRIGPAAEESSWPVNLLPPTEGSLDESTLLSLIRLLTEHSSDDGRNCYFYYGAVPLEIRGPAVYAGDLFGLLPFVRSEPDMYFTPNNIWPVDRSWFVYTDYDLWATRISGSNALIDALTEDSEIDAVRCG